MGNRKEEILIVALHLFARDGYEAVSVSQIAGELEYQNVSLDDFVEYSKSMFEYWTEDDFASSFRKMLTIEQFRSEEMQNLYQQYLVSGTAEYVKDLFKNMEIKIDEERLKSYKKLKAENSYMEDTGNYMLAKKKKFKEIAKYNKNHLTN